MKSSKILGIICLSILTVFSAVTFSYAAENKKINADVGTRRIPQGTVLNLKLIDPISTSAMNLGDQFDVMTIGDIKVGKNIIVPKGTVIRGSINKIVPSKMLSKGATIYLDFDHIVSPTGKQVPINVGMCSNQYLTYDGGLSSKTNYGTAIVQNGRNTAKIVSTSTKWGWETGSQVLHGYPKYVLAPVSAVVSVPVAGLYFIGDSVYDLFKKGDEVLINQGEVLKVLLTKPLDMPKY